MYCYFRDRGIISPSRGTLFLWVTLAFVIAVFEGRLHMRSRVEDSVSRVYRLFRPHRDARGPWRVAPDLVDPQATPMLVFVNRQSGGGLGQLVMDQLRAMPAVDQLQVWDLAWSQGGVWPPKTAFKPWLEYLRAGRPLRVLVCGGDGTVAWILGKDGICGLDKAMQLQVSVGILPFGTGNDIARSLGWGGSTRLDEVGGTTECSRNVLSDSRPPSPERHTHGVPGTAGQTGGCRRSGVVSFRLSLFHARKNPMPNECQINATKCQCVMSLQRCCSTGGRWTRAASRWTCTGTAGSDAGHRCA